MCSSDLQYLPDEFERIVEDVKATGRMFVESEMAILGATHEDIGGVLAERWNLPLLLREVTQYHHKPSPAREGYTMSAIVHAADIFVRAMDYGNGGDNKIPLMSDEVWKDIGLRGVPLQPLLSAIDDEVQKASALLEFV